MTKSIKRIIYIISALFIGLLVVAMDYFSVAKRVYADDNVIYNYDDTSIDRDLSGLDINIDLYPKDKDGNHQLIYFTEYCYSPKNWYEQYYGLYLYVYNPTEKKISKTSNCVNMAVEYNTEGKPSAYENVPLTFLNATGNNRFLKFKVTEGDRFLSMARAYANAHNGERRYDVVGIQLCFYDGTSVDTYEIKDEKVAKSYVWTGFAAGLGYDADAGSTLSCKSDTEHTLSLDVRSTYYRPDGERSPFVRDTLHSVYFAVPNKMLELYGEEITKIHAKWLEAFLKPILVTGNWDAYKIFEPWLGKNIEESNVEYGYFGNLHDGSLVSGVGITGLNSCGYSYYDSSSFDTFPVCTMSKGYDFDTLYYMFYSGSGEDSANNYIVESEELLKKLQNSYDDYGGNPIYGGQAVYSDKIFESVADDYTEKTIEATEEFPLNYYTLNESWWDWLFPGIGGVSNWTSVVRAIEPISEGELTYNKKIDSENLFIAESDIDAFYKYFDEYKQESTVYIFRYRMSEYISQEAALVDDALIGFDWFDSFTEVVDRNAYFFQSAMDLGFEIIDVTFEKEGVETVIGVVMSPMDIVPDADPPLETTSDADSWFEKLLKMVLFLLLIMILSPILPYLINGIGYLLKAAVKVIALPFKFIAWLIRRFRE